MFDHFPDIKNCPFCHTNEDKESILLPVKRIEGEKWEVEAVPVHLSCFLNSLEVFFDPEQDELCLFLTRSL